MQHADKIYVAGHTGMVGGALVNKLQSLGFTNIVTRSREQLDLLDQAAVTAFFEQEKPAYVFMAAGKTGGIYANITYRADFIYENTVMQSNVIHQSFLHEVAKLMFYACSSIYPKQCPQPMHEDHVLSGLLEPTNEPFAVAKITGLKMCEAYNRQYGTDFITLIPTNIYGPGQRYDPVNSPVIPALIQKFHEAKLAGQSVVTLWGTGRPTRDFMHVEDLAEASIYLMQNYEGNVLINVGTGKGCMIAQLAEIIKRVVGFAGEIAYDDSRPDGVATKLLDVSRINDLGWRHKIDIEEGIRRMYQEGTYDPCR